MTESGNDRIREYRTRDSRSVPGFGACLGTEKNESIIQRERKKSIMDPIDDETRVNHETTTLLWYDVEIGESKSPFEDDVK